MNINEAFPSNWIKAHDLSGDTHVTISGFKMGEYDDGKPAPSIQFSEFPGKWFGVNKTNAKTIAKLHGENTDGWKGKRITLYPTEVEFGGEMTMGVRVRLTTPDGTQATTNTPAPAVTGPTFGPSWADALEKKVAAVTAAHPAWTMLNLRDYIMEQAKGVDGNVLQGSVMNWPRAWMEPAKAWLEMDHTKEPESSIPF